VAVFDPAIQTRLIRDLEPAVALEIERLEKVAKNWYPHEYVHGVKAAPLLAHSMVMPGRRKILN